jgi:hypothetical protein
MTLIELNKKYYAFPTCWNELSTKQAMGAMKFFTSEHDTISEESSEKIILHLFRILAGISWWKWVRIKGEELAEYLYLCSFIWEETNLTKNVLPKYRNLYGPADNFGNLRMNEFAYAQNAFEEYKEKEDMSALNRLVAALYREAKPGYDFRLNPDSDCRQDFNEAVMNYHAEKVISKWPLYVKLLVLKWYAGCFEQMMKENQDLFSSNKSEVALHGIVSVMRNVAKSGTYGDFNSVEKMYVKMIMIELKETKHEADELEKSYKK